MVNVNLVKDNENWRFAQTLLNIGFNGDRIDYFTKKYHAQKNPYLTDIDNGDIARLIKDINAEEHVRCQLLSFGRSFGVLLMYTRSKSKLSFIWDNGGVANKRWYKDFISDFEQFILRWNSILDLKSFSMLCDTEDFFKISSFDNRANIEEFTFFLDTLNRLNKSIPCIKLTLDSREESIFNIARNRFDGKLYRGKSLVRNYRIIKNYQDV